MVLITTKPLITIPFNPDLGSIGMQPRPCLETGIELQVPPLEVGTACFPAGFPMFGIQMPTLDPVA